MDKLILIVATILVTGCASSGVWHHQSKSTQDFYQDNSQCMAMAGTGQANQVAGATDSFAQGFNLGSAIRTQSDRNLIHEQCMYGNGWYLGKVSSGAFTKIPVESFAKSIYWPALGSKVSVSIGERMTYSSKKAAVPSLQVDKDTVVEVPHSDRWVISTRILAGNYILSLRDNSGGTYYRPSQPLAWYYKSLRPGVADLKPEYHTGGIYLSPSGDTFVFFIWTGYTDPREISPAPGLRFSRITAEVDLPEAVQHAEVMYSGLSQSAINLRFREYWTGSQKPEFVQEVKYDLAQGRSVGYRDARFEILDATNTTITYRTTAHLK